MTDYLNMDFETLGDTMREQASRMRQLAGKTLPGDFQDRLLALALDYDCRADKLEQRKLLSHSTRYI